MININGISGIDCNTNEGKMLIAAMAILTSIEVGDIKSHKFGGMSHPDDVCDIVEDLANKIYHEEEYASYKKIEDRNKLIDKIINP